MSLLGNTDIFLVTHVDVALKNWYSYGTSFNDTLLLITPPICYLGVVEPDTRHKYVVGTPYVEELMALPPIRTVSPPRRAQGLPYARFRDRLDMTADNYLSNRSSQKLWNQTNKESMVVKEATLILNSKRQRRRKLLSYIPIYSIIMWVHRHCGAHVQRRLSSRQHSFVSFFPIPTVVQAFNPLGWIVYKKYQSSSLSAVHSNGDDHSTINYFSGENWRIHPALQPQIFQLPTIIVPNEVVHSLLRERGGDGSNTVTLSPFLATQMEELQGVHPRIKIVRDFPLSDVVGKTLDKKSSRISIQNLSTEDENNLSSSFHSKHLKLVLLHPERVVHGITTGNVEAISSNQSDGIKSESNLAKSFPGMDPSLLKYLDSLDIGKNITYIGIASTHWL
jgi:hypothetical protein